MTIDEAITLLKFNNKHIADLKNDDLQQIAEWLEELKSYRVHIFSGDMTQAILKEQYCKAIDDFVKEYKSCDNRSIQCKKFLNCADCIAEQLKAGITND